MRSRKKKGYNITYFADKGIYDVSKLKGAVIIGTGSTSDLPESDDTSDIEPHDETRAEDIEFDDIVDKKENYMKDEVIKDPEELAAHKRSVEKMQRLVTKSRARRKAGGFANFQADSLRLSGKTPAAFIDPDPNIIYETVSIDDDIKRYDGDSVTVKDVFVSSENIVWNGDAIRYKFNDVLLTANQYDYIEQHGNLAKNCFFAQPIDPTKKLAQVCKSLVRSASTARKDYGKEILNLTFGSVKWTRAEKGGSSAKAKTVTSPLLMCQITEIADVSEKGKIKFRIIPDTLRFNSLLMREMKAQNIDIFNDIEGINAAIIPSDERFPQILERVRQNAEIYSDVEVDPNATHLCLLDSSNEAICQVIENNYDNYADCALIQVLTGEKDYDEIDKEKVGDDAIYPMPADDSQREVVRKVLEGHSLNISAAAGTGKSHMMVMLAANFLIHNKQICIISEKRAALEVILKYAETIGLGEFCLEITNKMSVPKIVSQLERICAIEPKYVDKEKAEELLTDIRDLEEWFERYNRAVYSVMPELGTSFYNLVGAALDRDAVADLSSINVTPRNYRAAVRALNALQETLNTTLSEDEFSCFLTLGTTQDEDADALIAEDIEILSDLGIDIIAFIRGNEIAPQDVSMVAKANLARIIALDIIRDKEILGQSRNVFIQKKFAGIAARYTKLQSLHAAFLRQQLSARVTATAEEESGFVQQLSRLKTSRIKVRDLFRKYGDSIARLCPIIVTTPSAAINFITGDMNESFDALLIDEASQVPIINVLPFIAGKNQLIVFGDNMQLEITKTFDTTDITEIYAEDGTYDLSATDESILHMVQGKLPDARLGYHYRSKTQHLIAVSNEKCYSGLLNVTPDVYTGWDNLPTDLGFEIREVTTPFDKSKANAPDGDEYIKRYACDAQSNLFEGVAHYVVDLLDSIPENKTIGVVTLSLAARHKVVDMLEYHCLVVWKLEIENKLWVRSLENAQGKEADIIVIVIDHAERRKDGVIKQTIAGSINTGTVNEQAANNRLNVLFSRAREKNAIFMTFNYNEIKGRTGSLGRLYTYLHYAATGDMPRSERQSAAMDKTNECAARLIEKVFDGSREVYRKVGNSALTVELALKDIANPERFEAGFLLSDIPLSPNALYTKINLLERSGWKVHPLSLTSLIGNSQQFFKSLSSLMKLPSLGNATKEDFLTDRVPDKPLTLRELATGRLSEEYENSEDDFVEAEIVIPGENSLGLTMEEFVSLGVESICRKTCSRGIRTAPMETINMWFRQNTQALLVKLAHSAHRAAEKGNIETLIKVKQNTQKLYEVWQEKHACYLLAQLMRLLRSPETAAEDDVKIAMLLEEAKELKIGEDQ